MEEARQAILDAINELKDKNDYFYTAGLINMAMLCEVITAEESIKLTIQLGNRLEEIVLGEL